MRPLPLGAGAWNGARLVPHTLVQVNTKQSAILTAVSRAQSLGLPSPILPSSRARSPYIFPVAATRLLEEAHSGNGRAAHSPTTTGGPSGDHQVTANLLAQSDHPFYRNPDEIIVTRSRHCRAGVLCYRASRSSRRTISAAVWAGRRMAHCAPWWRGATQSCARISLDNGLTWLPERYRPIFGFGYPGSLVLEDDTIVTITGLAG